MKIEKSWFKTKLEFEIGEIANFNSYPYSMMSGLTDWIYKNFKLDIFNAHKEKESK